MTLFKNITISDFSEILLEPVKSRDEFTPELFDNEILFLDTKCVPLTDEISHYLLFGIPDCPSRLKSLDGIMVFVQNINLGDKKNFERLFRKWFMSSSHTLVVFDSLGMLPTVVKNLNLSSFDCKILDLSLLLPLSRNGLSKNNQFIWGLLKDGFLDNEDIKNLSADELEIKATQLNKKKESQNWKEMPHNTENVLFLVDEVVKIGDYLKEYCMNDAQNNWCKSFSHSQKGIHIHATEVYYSFFEPLIKPFIYLRVEGVQIDMQNNQKIQQNLNLQYQKIQSEFQKYFQIDFMDLQSIQDFLALFKKFQLPWPDNIERTLKFIVDESTIMNKEILQTFIREMSQDLSPEIQLLTEGFIWRQKNTSFMQNILKIKDGRMFFNYNFGDELLGSIQTDFFEKEFIFLPDKNHIFLRVEFKNMTLRILTQLAEEDEKKWFLQNPQEVSPKVIILNNPAIKDFRLESKLNTVKNKINQILSESQNPVGRVTSLGGIPFITSLDTQFIELILFLIDFSVFEIISLILQQILAKSKVIFIAIDRESVILQCQQNIVQSQIQEIHQIVQQVGQEVLPFSGLTCEISQLEKLEHFFSP